MITFSSRECWPLTSMEISLHDITGAYLFNIGTFCCVTWVSVPLPAIITIRDSLITLQYQDTRVHNDASF